ncbi:MAG: coenzyme F420-0:L-glutamate ligase [Methanomicrobiales archaeon]|jgi:coenzyme F420-0:L-glutamate ligase|nr:coenzyme F420-0:L-glutamate ligase [Methanomicrobiales archaeon]
MTKRHLSLFGISTRIIHPTEPLVPILIDSIQAEIGMELQDGDIIVLAESAVATAQGRVISLESIVPSERAKRYAEQYEMNPALCELVLQESKEIVGGIPGFLLALVEDTLLPNAGIDGSNAPIGHVVLLPKEPNKCAKSIQEELERAFGVSLAVLIIDSRTHPMRYGCSGVAIGCSGIEAVIDDVGRMDLFGNRLEVTKRAVADNIASAAELLMGEADEAVPLVIVRGAKGTVPPITDDYGIERISPDECLFMGVMRRNRAER